MASQTKQPQDHKPSADQLQAEALKDNKNLDLLKKPGQVRRSVRIRALALMSTLDVGDSEEDFDSSQTMQFVSDMSDFIEANCWPDDKESRDKLEALSDTDWIELVTAYAALLGESMGSKG